MRIIALHLSLIVFLLINVTSGCKSSANDVAAPIPELNIGSAEIGIGETIEIKILNASHIHGISAPETVSVNLSEMSLFITGIEKCICDVRLTADNTPLSCRIKVIERRETPEKPDDNLKDKTSRAEGNGISLRYTKPGIIVKLSGDTVELRDLNSGEYAVSTVKALNINGATVSTQPREVIKSDDDTKWYRHRIADNDYVWVVVSDL